MEVPHILSEGPVLILKSALLIEGEERDSASLSKEELDLVREVIKPSFKSDHYKENEFKWLFRLFKIYYQRQYDSEFQENQKYKIFQSNLRLMNDINSQNKSFSVRINKFADQEDIAMPPGLMKNLHEKNIKKETKSFSFLNKNYSSSFKLDKKIKNEMELKEKINSNEGLLKGPESGLNKFAIKTDNLTDPDEPILENSKFVWIF
jgi:hypothetical protein